MLIMQPNITARVLLLIILITLVTPIQAAPLTRGNIFAEALAGCSVGIAFGLINAVLITTQAAPIALESATAFNHSRIVRYCLTGSILDITIYGIIEISNLSRELFHSHEAIEQKIPMLYPETPEREY